MKLTISNLIEAIYLDIFSLGQNIELQIMAAWVHLSTYLLFVINLSHSNCSMQKAQSSDRPWSNTDLKSPDKETNFSFKKGKKQNKKRMISTLPIRHTKFEVASTSI